jgi:hypothetical protein
VLIGFIKYEIEWNDDELKELIISNINEVKQESHERHELDDEHKN